MPESKIFYQGTEAQYDTYQTWVNDAGRANIPAEGTINQISGVDAPNNQRTVKYSEKIPHSVNGDDFVWEFGLYPNVTYGLTEYTLTEAVSNGYISNDDPSTL